jgi:hypothetical protein
VPVNVAPKHEKLIEDNTKDGGTEVELIKNKYTKNIASPFVSQSKVWDDNEHWQIPEDI